VFHASKPQPTYHGTLLVHVWHPDYKNMDEKLGIFEDKADSILDLSGRSKLRSTPPSIQASHSSVTSTSQPNRLPNAAIPEGSRTLSLFQQHQPLNASNRSRKLRSGNPILPNSDPLTKSPQIKSWYLSPPHLRPSAIMYPILHYIRRNLLTLLQRIWQISLIMSSMNTTNRMMSQRWNSSLR